VVTDQLQRYFSRFFKEIRVSVNLTETGDPIYVSGAVVIPGTYPYLPGRSVEDYIGLAGGGSEEANVANAQVIRADGTFLAGELVSFLKPGETILVPQEYVYVQGAVFEPGPFPFRSGRTVEDYLGLAGGPTNRAHMSAMRLVRSDGSINEASGEMLVDVGETVVLPELTLKWPQDYLTLVGFLSSTFITWYLLLR
jgi:protein involved in polysaccharide export with SLBB domain